jgi:glycosyltransferase involved in cell wall biosynthesis
MEILLVNYEKDWGGAENVFSVYAQILQSSGYKVTVYVQSDGELVKRCNNILGVEVLTWRTSSGFFGYFSGLFKLLRRNEYSCIVLNNQKAILGAPLVKLLNKGFVIGYEHTPQPNSFRSWLLNNLIKSWIDKYICVSQFMFNCRAESVQHKCIQIYNGFKDSGTSNLCSDNVHTGKLTIGVLSIFRRWKGHHYVIQALSILRSRGIEVNCIFVGGPDSSDPAYYSECEELIIKLGLTSCVDMRGFCADAPEVMRKDIDVLIQPSLNPDPLPTTVIEALMLGKPIVAFNQGGIAEMVEHQKNGILIDNPDSIELADAIQKYHDDIELISSHGFTSRDRFLSQFSLDKYRSNFMKTINDATSVRKC